MIFLVKTLKHSQGLNGPIFQLNNSNTDNAIWFLFKKKIHFFIFKADYMHSITLSYTMFWMVSKN